MRKRLVQIKQKIAQFRSVCVVPAWMRTPYALRCPQWSSAGKNFETILTIQTIYREAVSKRFSLSKGKEGENFNHRNTWSISRIALKLHCVPKFEPDVEIGQNGAF